MPAPNWAAGLGAALGGNSEAEYEKGRALGANTEDALAQARRRVMENDALTRGRQTLISSGVPEAQADAAYTALQAGGKLDDPIQLMLKNQEYGFRNTAGDPNTTPGNANAALRGVASGPVEPLYKIGSNYASKFGDTDTVTPLPGGENGGGTSAGMQALKAFGFIDPKTGGIVPGREADAFDLYRDTTRNVDAGGVPLQTSNNPFRRGAPHVVAPAAEVAANAGEVASGKEQGTQQGLAAVKLPEALSDLNNMQGNIDRLLSKPGFDSIYGARVGATETGQAINNFVSQDASNAAADRQQLGANAFIVSIVKNRGQGQLSNAEGLKFTDAFTRATNPRLSPEEARAAWIETRHYIDLIKERLQKSAAPTTGASSAQDGAPAALAGRVKVIGGKKYVETAPGQWAEDDGA